MALKGGFFNAERKKKRKSEKKVTFPLLLFANVLPNAYPFEVLKERRDMLVVRKAKKKIVRPDGLHEAWVYQSPAMPLIAFKDVMQECAESCGEHPSKTTGVVIALMDCIVHYLKLGRSVRIDGIGTLKPVISSESAATAEELDAPEISIKGVKLRFYPHQPLQKAIAENGYEYQPELDDK